MLLERLAALVKLERLHNLELNEVIDIVPDHLEYLNAKIPLVQTTSAVSDGVVKVRKAISDIFPGNQGKFPWQLVPVL
jgi:hypothetical protein